MRTRSYISYLLAAAVLAFAWTVFTESSRMVDELFHPSPAVANAPDPTTPLPGIVKTKHAQLRVVLYDPETEQSFGPMSRREAEAHKYSYPHAEVLVPDDLGRYPVVAEPASFESRFAAAH